MENRKNNSLEIDISTCSIIIFGASGDLTKRKLIPALYRLDSQGHLPNDLKVLGIARTEYDDQAFRKHLAQELEADNHLDNEIWKNFTSRLHYLTGDYNDPQLYRQLAENISGNLLFYLAVPPAVFPTIVEQLSQAGLSQSQNGWRRLVIEKPFGRDYQSACHLNDLLHNDFKEDQIFRIDHFLGKETVQNIMAFRFANAIFEPLWNLKYVDHIQISALERVGVEHRGGYYDQAGILRDIFQNHLLQLLTLIAMEPPVVWESNALSDKKVEVLRALQPVKRSLRGQYQGYTQEKQVDYDSQTATFAALELFVDNWRWQNVPFYLRSGKSLAAKATELAIYFKHVPHLLFPLEQGEEIPANVISLCIQPDEGMHLRFQAKWPGKGMQTHPVEMDFHYSEGLDEQLPKAYERLLMDALQGDTALFARSDEIELAWKLIDPIIENWESSQAPPLHQYEPGSWGPETAADFLRGGHRKWQQLCAQHAEQSS